MSDNKREFMINMRRAEQEDLPRLLDIYNYEVAHGVATLDLQEKTLEERQQWLDEHNVGNHPLYVAVVDEEIAGYVSLSSYREKEAYKSTVELSIYVAPEFRGQKVATTMMGFILEEARRDERTHLVVSVITAGNAISTKLHEKFGFTFCGTIHEVGVKFGQMLDIENYELIV